VIKTNKEFCSQFSILRLEAGKVVLRAPRGCAAYRGEVAAAKAMATEGAARGKMEEVEDKCDMKTRLRDAMMRLNIFQEWKG
jgi:hypothetical protein